MKYDIESLKRKMLVKYPFFGSVIADVNYQEDKSLSTAGTNGETIYYNPNYLNNLSTEEQTFVFAHEVCHIAFNHILRSEGKDVNLWNIATDGVINQFLKRDGLKIPNGRVDIAEAINYDAEQLYEKLLQEQQQKQGNNQNNQNHQNQHDNSNSNNQKNGNSQNSNNEQQGNDSQEQGSGKSQNGQDNNQTSSNSKNSEKDSQEQNIQQENPNQNSNLDNKNNQSNKNSQNENQDDHQKGSSGQNNENSQSSEDSQEQNNVQDNGQKNDQQDSQKQNNNSNQNSENGEQNNSSKEQNQEIGEQNNQSTNSQSQGGQNGQQSDGSKDSTSEQNSGDESSQPSDNHSTNNDDSLDSKEYKDVGHDTHSMWEEAVKKHKEQEKNKEKKNNKINKEIKNDKDNDDFKKKQEELENMGEKNAFKKNLEDRKKQLEELKEALSKLASQAGSFSNEDVRKVENIGISKPLIDWRYVLKEAIKYDVDWSYQNATIEDGVITPNLEEQPKPETEIVLDTSGSISEVLLKNFLRECKNILQQSRLKVGCFDTRFYGFHEIRTEQDIENMKFVGGGGTDFNVAVKAFTRRVENKIIFTDGEAAMPYMPIDAIWIVFGQIQIYPMGGRVIYITPEQLNKLYKSDFNDNVRKRTR